MFRNRKMQLNYIKICSVLVSVCFSFINQIKWAGTSFPQGKHRVCRELHSRRKGIQRDCKSFGQELSKFHFWQSAISQVQLNGWAGNCKHHNSNQHPKSGVQLQRVLTCNVWLQELRFTAEVVVRVLNVDRSRVVSQSYKI